MIFDNKCLEFHDSLSLINFTKIHFETILLQFVLIAMAIIVFMEAKKKNRVAAEREERKKRRTADIVIVEPLPEKPMKHYTVADPETSEPGDAVQAW